MCWYVFLLMKQNKTPNKIINTNQRTTITNTCYILFIRHLNLNKQINKSINKSHIFVPKYWMYTNPLNINHLKYSDFVQKKVKIVKNYRNR